jgi:hypothetical protein
MICWLVFTALAQTKTVVPQLGCLLRGNIRKGVQNFLVEGEEETSLQQGVDFRRKM